MGYKTTTTRISSAKSTKSRQTTSYQYPSGNGVVLAGSTINSQTTAYLDVTVPGQARAFTAVSGGGTTTIISNLQYLDTNNIVTNAIAVSTTGGNILINGNGFANTSRVYVNNQLVTNTFVNSNAIIATLSANSVGNVSLAIFNSSGQSGVFSNSNVRFSGAPSWVSSGAISSYNDVASNIALEASGDGTLTYSLQSGSGSLPSGISLVSTGYLSGTATGYTSDTVFTFTLVVTDAEGQAAQQNYSYTVFIGDTYFKQTSLLLSADTANTFISDSSTNNFLVSRFGDTRPSRFSPYWPGGWSVYFDGSGDFLTSSATMPTSGDFSIELWFYVANGLSYLISGGGTYAARLISGIGTNAMEFLIESASGSTTVPSKLIGSSYGTANYQFVASGLTIPVNTWNHAVLCRVGSNNAIFLNGTRVGTFTSSYSFASSTVSVGGNSGAAAGYLDYLTGYVNSVRIVKGSSVYDPTQTSITVNSTRPLSPVANCYLLTARSSSLVDESGQNATVSFNGDTKLTTFSPFNTTPYTFTANSNSVYFDGTGDSVQAPAGSAFAYGTGDFTIEGWFYALGSSLPQYGSTIYAQTVSGTNYLIIVIESNNKITAYYATSGAGTGPSSANTWNYNSWNHFAFVRSGNTAKIYLNGITSTGVSCTQDFNNTTYNPSIGRVSHGEGQLLTGYVSNLRVLKGTAQYTANFTPSTTALTSIANTSLLTCQSTTVIDNSTNNFTLTVNGNPNVSIVNPFGENVSTISNYTWSANSYSASGYFDGTGDYLNAGSNSAFAFGTGAYTIECWIYPTTTTTQVYTGIRATGGLQLYYDPTAGFGVSSVGSPGFLFAGTLAINQWYHIAVCRTSTSSNSTFIFVNGILRATGTDSTNWTVNGPLIIGANQSGTEAFTGYISNVRWIKGSAAYNRSFIPPAAPLTAVANTSILTLQTDVGSNSVQFVDQSAQNNLITRNGNASQGAYSPLVPSTWSAYFDGTGDYIYTDLAIDLLAFGSGDFTVELWINPSSASAGYVYIDFRPAATQGAYFVLYQTGSSLRLYVNNADRITGGSLTANSWNHVAVTRSGTSTKLFINGIQSGSTYTDTTVYLQPSFRPIIGASTGLTDYFNGYISNLRMVKGTALYTANFTPSTTTIGPVANTSLLTLREPILADNSGNNFTIFRNGDVKIVPFGPFSPQTVTPDSYSYRFSNASDYISTTNSNLALGTNNWTVESWVYPRFTANSGIFQISNVQYGLTNSNLNTVALGFSSGNKAIVRVANATYTSTGTTITANAWTHLALVKSSNVSKLYINGTLDSTIGTSGSITDTVNYTGTTNIAVGGYGSTSALANAYISNFRVVSNSAVYTQNFTVNTGPISAISGTTLLTCQANTIVDSSAANLTITANANVTPSKFNPFDETVTVGQTYSGASAGGSAYFDGTGDYLSSATNPIFNLLSDFTIEAWVYLTGQPTADVGNNKSAGIVSYMSPSAADTGWEFSVDFTNNRLTLASWGSGSNYIYCSLTPSLNVWYHFAATKSGSTTRLFINGVSQTTTGTLTINVASAPTLSIGRGSSNANYLHNLVGYISGVRIISGNALYTSNFVPPAAPALPTTANTSLLLNFTNSGVVDATGRNVLETVNDARVVTSTYKYGSGSYYFDGTGDYIYVMGTSSEMAFGTGDFTVEFWYYSNNTGIQQIVYDSRPSSTNGAYLVVYKPSGNVFSIYVDNAQRIVGTTTISANTWYHIAVCRSGTNTKLFVNGTQDGSTFTSDTFSYSNGTNRPVIGTDGASIGSSPVNGYIDDLRITKGYARYTANFTAPTAPFVTK